MTAEQKLEAAIRKSVSDCRRLNAIFAKNVSGMKPPENLTVSQWADKKRRLSPESSAEPGPWRTSRTPYLREIMDAFNDPKVRRIVFVSSSQIGKSECMNNIIGYIIDEDPGSILFIHPTTVDAKEYSKLRIAPMIRDCKTLRSKVAVAKSRDSANTILQKSYPGGLLTLCGSTEAHSLASKPIRYLFGDERDRWATSAGKEGDPWELATARQITFYNSKSFEASTPTIKNASAIEASFLEGTMERWNVQCPHCREYNDIKFSDIRYEHVEEVIQGKRHFAVTSIWYICPACACISAEGEIKKQPAKWVPENPNAYQNGVRSFWLNSFVSPWATWESTILKYLYAIGSSEKLQVVYNTRFGQLWENRGDLEDEESILARREEYEAELPDGVLVLCCGVDTQDDRLEYEVVGYGHFKETWGIKKGIIMGRPDDPATWAQLDEALNHRYSFQNGVTLRISLTFIDEGGHFTQDVRMQCRTRFAKNVFAIKGRGGPNVPYTAPPKKQKIIIRKTQVGMCWQYEIGVDAGKQQIMDNLRVQTPGQKYCHFPKRDDYGPAYFAGLLSERLVYKEGRKQPWVWEVIPGHERNEPLDCRNYANAAFKALPCDLDAIDRRIKAATAERPAVTVATVQQQKKKPPRKNRSGGIDRHFDEW